jgi:hypothetical protein
MSSSAVVDPYPGQLLAALYACYADRDVSNAAIYLIHARLMQWGGVCAASECDERFRLDWLAAGSRNQELVWHHIGDPDQCQHEHHDHMWPSGWSLDKLRRHLDLCAPVHGKVLPQCGPPHCHRLLHNRWAASSTAHAGPTACPTHPNHCPSSRPDV